MKDPDIISRQKAVKLIRDINRMDLKTADYEYIKEIVILLTNAHFIGGHIDSDNRKLFRANIVKEGKPANATRLSYPPVSLIDDYQRCKSPRNPVFYCATDKVTACWEIHAEVGDIVYISNWSVIHPFYCHLSKPVKNFSNVSDTVAKFIENKFTEAIDGSLNYRYKVAAAISEVLTDPNILMTGFEDDASHYGLRSIQYPSVANVNRSHCYALSTEVADNCLRLDYVQEVVLVAVHDRTIEFDVKDESSNILSDGTIVWMKREGKQINNSLNSPLPAE